MRFFLKKTIFLLLLVFCFSCKDKTDNQLFIDRLATVQNGLPSPYFTYRLYFKLDNKEILETNVNLLYDIYNDFYKEKHKNFNDFLVKLILRKEIISFEKLGKYERNNYLLNITKPDFTIEKMDIKKIEKNYFEKDEQNYLFYPKKIDLPVTNTILYKMFINNYIIQLNDYGGYYTIKKYKEGDFK